MRHVPTFDVTCLSGSLPEDRATVTVGDDLDDNMVITFKAEDDDICAVAMTHAQWWALVDSMKEWLATAEAP